ncbi:virulence protein [Pasteurella multocida]|uniref:virulence protein n=1 Tax=Pasteurella multocida TaxID=747 RepID=UPI001F0F6818|nr:virulence protein [Pasteurella multocida]
MLIKASEFLLYCSDDESVRLNVLIKDENIWLTQKAMAELFDVNPPAINKHLSNIFAEGELEQGATISKMEIVQQEGHRHVKRSLDFYNLDALFLLVIGLIRLKPLNFVFGQLKR